MARLITILAYLSNLALIAIALFAATQAYGRDVIFAVALVVPPLLALLALRCGPDGEERKLIRAVSKARLKRELAALQKGE